MNIIELIQAWSTIALVVITALYVIITYKILNSSKEALQEQLRPYIIVNIASIDFLLTLKIKNIGKRPAINVDITLEPDLKAIEKITNYKPLLKQSYMPPDFEINTKLMYSQDFVKNKNLPKTFEVKIEYKDYSGTLFCENYTINLAAYIYAEKSMEKLSNNYLLGEINKELIKIPKKLQNLLNEKEKERRFGEAIKFYDKFIEINSNDSKAWYDKGVALYELGVYKKAIKCYDKAIEINPDDSDAWNDKGIVLYQLRRYKEAIKCYDKAIEINSVDAVLWDNKGHVFDKLGRKSEAQRCYDKAIEIKKDEKQT